MNPLYRCYNCCDAGCENCDPYSRKVEPFPPETFIDYSDDDLDRLVVDVRLEMDRRYLRLLELERMWEI